VVDRWGFRTSAASPPTSTDFVRTAWVRVMSNRRSSSQGQKSEAGNGSSGATASGGPGAGQPRVVYRIVGVNYRLIAALLGLLLVLGVGSYFSRRVFINRNAQQLLTQAEKLREDQQTPQALDKIRQYNLLKKGDREAALLSTRILKQGDFSDTRRLPFTSVSDQLSDALVRQPNDPELLRESLLLASFLNQSESVLNQYAPALEEELQTDPQLLRAVLSTCLRAKEAETLVRTSLKAIEAKLPSVVPYEMLIEQVLTNSTAPALLSDLRRQFASPTPARGTDPDGANPESTTGKRVPADLERLVRAILESMGNDLPPSAQEKAAPVRVRTLLGLGDMVSARRELEAASTKWPDSGDLAALTAEVTQRELNLARRSQRSVETRQAIAEKLLAATERWRKCGGLDEGEARLALAMQYMELQKPGDSLRELQAADKFALGAKASEEGGYEEAQRLGLLRYRIRERALISNPDYKRLLPEQKEELEAWRQEVVEWLQERKNYSEVLEFASALDEIGAGNWQNAAEQLERLRPAYIANNDVRLRRILELQLVRCHRELNNPDALISVLKRGLELDPEWVEGQLLLVGALEISGRRAEAQTLSDTTERKLEEGDLRALVLEFTRLKRQADNTKGLQDLLTKLDQAAPSDEPPGPEFAELRTDVLWSLKRFDEAREYLAGLERQSGSTPQLTIRRAQAEMLGRDEEEARSAVKKFLAEVGNEASRDSANLRLLKTQLAISESPADAEAIIRAQTEGMDKLADEEQTQVLMSMARAAITQRANPLAFDLMGRALERNPNNVGLILQIAIMQVLTGAEPAQIAGIQTRLDELEGKGGPHASFLRGLVSQRRLQALVNKARKSETKPDEAEVKTLLNESRNEFRQALRGRPSWREAHTQLALVEWGLDNADAGFEQANQAFELGERSQQLINGMVGYLQSRRRDAELLSLVEKVRAEGRNTPESLLRSGVDALTRGGNVEGALELLREVDDRSTDDGVFEALLMISRGEDLPRAEELLRLGLNGGGFRAEAAAAALVKLLIREKRATEVIPLLAEIEAKVADEPAGRRSALLGDCRELMGQTDEALALFRAASQEDPARTEFYRRHQDFLIRQRKFPEAIAMQKKLLAYRESQSEPVPEEQRLRLAAISSDAASTYEEYQAAIEMITGGKPLGELSVNALRVLMRALPRSSLKSDRERMIAVLDELQKRLQQSDADRRLKAFLLQEAGRWNDSWVLYKELMHDNPTDPLLMSTFVQAATTQKDPSPALLKDMDKSLEVLLSTEPNSFRTAAARARYLAATKRETEAVPVLERFLNRINSVEVSSLFEELLRMRQAGYVRELITQKAAERTDRYAANVIAIAPQLLANPETSGEIDRALQSYLGEADVRDRVRNSMKLSIAEMCESLGSIELAEQILLDVRKGWDGPGLDVVLAGFYSRQNRPEEALKIVDGLKNVPDVLVAQVGVGVLRAAKVDAEQARPFEDRILQLQRKAVDKDANSWQVFTMALTDLYDHLGRFDEGAKLYRALLAKNPSNPVALNNLAWLLAFSDQASDRDEAVKMINEAVRLAGPVAELLDTRGVVLMQVGRAEQAVAALQTAVRESPTPNSLFHLAVAELRAERRADARKTYERALSLGFSVDKLHALETGLLSELKTGLDLAAVSPRSRDVPFGKLRRPA